MEFKKPSKEDMPVIIISVSIVIMMAISSATSKTKETGEPLELWQWLSVNLFIIAITAIIDMTIIRKREKKRKESEIAKEIEKARRERAEKEITVAVSVKSGAIGIDGICQMHQLFENHLFYLVTKLKHYMKWLDMSGMAQNTRE